MDVQRTMEFILEQVAVLGSGAAEHERRMAEHERRMAEHEQRMAEHAQRMAEMETTLGRLGDIMQQAISLTRLLAEQQQQTNTRMNQLVEQQAETRETLNVLLRTVDDLIRRASQNPPFSGR